jgi:hypothetical protein
LFLTRGFSACLRSNGWRIIYRFLEAERNTATSRAEPGKLPGKKTPPNLILRRKKGGGTELGPIPPPVATNLDSRFLSVKYLLPAMKKKWSRFVGISSNMVGLEMSSPETPYAKPAAQLGDQNDRYNDASNS